MLRAVLHGHTGISHRASEPVGHPAELGPQLLGLEPGVVPVRPIAHHVGPCVRVDAGDQHEADGGQVGGGQTLQEKPEGGTARHAGRELGERNEPHVDDAERGSSGGERGPRGRGVEQE